MIFRRFLLLPIIIGASITIQAQDTIRISLQDAIVRASKESVAAIGARSEYISSYWQYRTYKSELLPEVTLTGKLPYYSKSYNPYQSEDGSYKYVSNDYSQIDLGLSITQNIPLTGGKISVESSLQRLEQYGNNSFTRYKSIPGAITLEQPVFGFNRVGWMRKIEPIKKIESEQKLIADIEDIAYTVVEYYFDLILGKVNLDIAIQNLENSSKVYSIAEARRKIGQISENELLQLKVSMLNAESALTDAQLSLNARMFQLRSFLGYGEDIVLDAILPQFNTDKIPELYYPKVLAEALSNNAFTQNVQRRILEATQEVSQAKADRWNFSLFASVGVSGQEDKFGNAYYSHNMRGNQIVEVGIKLPILDWGKRKGKVKVAEANKAVVQSKLDKEQMDFKQNIYLAVQNFNNQWKQLKIAEEADKIARQRYNTSVEAFILGKIDVLNLNDAQTSKDIARRNYIQQISALWSFHYQIRSLTLYDFVEDRKLTVNYADYLN